ncbi:MAG TPA: hypothetical protein VHY33_08560 [Thermoanaerobaculia bacterium]|jgi:hypothetical protein|nr:hypothetical protein [Thermoanaerobaculia bacterium]
MARKPKHDDEMRSHYDFSAGVRGKYAARYAEGTNVVVLAQGVAEMFPDSVAVKEDLRTSSVIQLSRSEAKLYPRSATNDRDRSRKP